MNNEELQELRKKKSALIWAGGPAREIMRLARIIFREVRKTAPTSAYVGLASDHYSLVKRYRTWWGWPLGVWHFILALDSANQADAIAKAYSSGLTASQTDVVSRIFSKLHPWFGRYRRRAMELIEIALRERAMKPHDRALMFCTLSDFYWEEGEANTSWRHRLEALCLVPEIEREDSPDCYRQLVRVLKSVGFFYIDHGGKELRPDGLALVRRAQNLSHRYTLDQEMDIMLECRKRGIT